jgi:hypothetical protein
MSYESKVIKPMLASSQAFSLLAAGTGALNNSLREL